MGLKSFSWNPVRHTNLITFQSLFSLFLFQLEFVFNIKYGTCGTANRKTATMYSHHLFRWRNYARKKKWIMFDNATLGEGREIPHSLLDLSKQHIVGNGSMLSIDLGHHHCWKFDIVNPFMRTYTICDGQCDGPTFYVHTTNSFRRHSQLFPQLSNIQSSLVISSTRPKTHKKYLSYRDYVITSDKDIPPYF